MAFSVRSIVNIALAVLALTVAASFTFALYLRSRGGTMISARPPSTLTIDELVVEGNRHLQRQRAEQALFAYRRALAIDPQSFDAQVGVARSELLAGRDDEAAGGYERALTLRPDDSPVMRELAILYSRRETTWSQAERTFTRYLTLQPDDAGAQLRLARVLAWLGRAEAASRLFFRSTVAGLMTVEDHTAHAFALITIGQTREASRVIEDLRSRGHEDPRLTLQLAHIYAARNNWTAAIPLYVQVLRTDPADGHLNKSYGMALLALGRHTEAVEPLRRASQAMPSDGAAGLAYARALKGANRGAAAAREFRRVMPMYARDAPVTREFADLLLEQKQYGESARQYKQAVSLGLSDVRLYLGLSGALQASRKPREALPFLQQAYRLAPTRRVGWELARLLNRLGDNKQALAVLDGLPSANAAF